MVHSRIDSRSGARGCLRASVENQGGIEMQFKAGAPLVSTLLRGLLDTASAQKKDGGCRTYIIDDSDAVGGWESDEVC